MNQVAHSIPRDSSSTCVYGVANGRPRKETNASQNHSGSSIDRRRSASKSVNPCAAMNRPTLLVAASSGVGIHAASGTGAGYR